MKNAEHRRKNSPRYRHFVVDTGATGEQETWARSAAEAINNVRFRFRRQRIPVRLEYWGGAREIGANAGAARGKLERAHSEGRR